MKTIRVKTTNKNDPQKQITAESEAQFKEKVAAALNLQLKSIKIIKPIPKTKPFEKYEQGEQVTIMGTAVKTVVETPLSSKDSTVVKSTRPSMNRKDVIFKAPIDNTDFEGYSEYFAWIFLMYRCKELGRWLQRKNYDSAPAQRFIKEINRVSAKLVDPHRSQPIPVMALLLIWWGYRQFDCSKDPDRANPCELVYDWSRVICHDFMLQMKEKTDIVKQLFSVGYDVTVVGSKQKEIVNRFEPFLSVRTNVELGNLTQLFTEKYIEVPQFITDENQGKPPTGLNYRFAHFTKLPLYLLVRINRFSSPNRKDRRVIRFPKLLDVHKMCNTYLKDKMSAGRDRHEQQLKAMASRIATEKKNLSRTEDLNATQIAYACFDRFWSSYEYEDRYYNMNDVNYPQCFSGCYNLVGFTTHLGKHPQEAEFATVIEMRRNEWYHCTARDVRVLTTEQAMNNYNGMVEQTKDSQDCQTAELLLYRKVYYECELDNF